MQALKVLSSNPIIINSYLRTYPMLIQISVRVEVVRLVRVRAYTRWRNGRQVKVRSHYRRY